MNLTCIERWSPRGSDREFAIFTEESSPVTFAYREFDNSGRVRAAGNGLSVEAVRAALDNWRADFPSAHVTQASSKLTA